MLYCFARRPCWQTCLCCGQASHVRQASRSVANTHTHTRILVHVLTYIHIHTNIHTCADTFIYTQTSQTYTPKHIHTNIHTHTYIHEHTNIYTLRYTHKHTHSNEQEAPVRLRSWPSSLKSCKHTRQSIRHINKWVLERTLHDPIHILSKLNGARTCKNLGRLQKHAIASLKASSSSSAVSTKQWAHSCVSVPPLNRSVRF
jgi:hypothetical protein